MLVRADLSYINKLHDVGRELTVLKRIYQSYDQVIGHVLRGQKAVGTGEPRDFKSDSPPQAMESSEPGESSQTRGRKAQFGPTLATEAVNRFERLRDRIRIYALSEIQDCLDEKESMAFMVGLPSYLPTSSVHAVISWEANGASYDDVEFQFDRHKRVSGGRTSDPHHDPLGQSHHYLPSRQPYDGIFLDSGERRAVHRRVVLDLFRHHHEPLAHLLGLLRYP